MIAHSAKPSAASIDTHKSLIAELRGELANWDFRVRAAYFARMTVYNTLMEALKEFEKVEALLAKNSETK